MALSKIDSGGISASGITADSLNIGQIGGRRNLIINGAMIHDQRNGGSSVTPTASGTYTLDRWRANISVSSKFSVQQSTVAPANHTNSLLVTSLAATTVSASNQYFIGTRLEGYNIAHLKFGTADAQSITLSFWVRSSLTGTFGAGVFNSAANRCYPISYTISSANTWEQKTVTIPGDTSGTWLTNNGVGLQLIFSLGIGSTFQGTAGAWTSSAHLTASSTVNLVETNGATLYITGVQLEVGSVATPFEHRSYGEELFSCYRYYYKIIPGAADLYFPFLMHSYDNNNAIGVGAYPVEMRTAPTALEISSATDFKINKPAAYNVVTTDVTHGSSTSSFVYNIVATSSGLTAHDGAFLRTTGSGVYLAWSAEL